jgi:hypothetical protein
MLKSNYYGHHAIPKNSRYRYIGKMQSQTNIVICFEISPKLDGVPTADFLSLCQNLVSFMYVTFIPIKQESFDFSIIKIPLCSIFMIIDLNCQGKDSYTHLRLFGYLAGVCPAKMQKPKQPHLSDFI